MTLVDVVLGVVWLGITLGGFWKGALRIVFGLSGLVLGLWLAVATHLEVAERLAPWVQPPLATVLGWLLPSLVCLGLAVAAGWGLQRTLEALHLGWLDRLAGAALAGLVGAVLLLGVVLVAAGASPVVAELCARSSLLTSITRLLPAGVADLLAPADPVEPPAEDDPGDELGPRDSSSLSGRVATLG